MELAEQTADACFENLTGTSRTIRALGERVRERTPPVEVTASLGPHPEFALSLAAPHGSRSDLEALRLPQDMASRVDGQFIFVYDEFQEVGPLGRALLGRMRAQRVSYVFLGSQESMLRLLFARGSQPFCRFGMAPAAEGLGGLPGPQVRAGRPQGLWRRGCGAGAAGRAHPLTTILGADEAAHLARTGHPARITEHVAQLTSARVQAAPVRAFEDAWPALSAPARHVCRRIAAGAGPYAQSTPNRAQIQRAIRTMVASGVRQATPPRGHRFVEPMFADYVRNLEGR